MLHAPVTDRKNKEESTNSATLAEYEQQNQKVNWSGRSPQSSTTSVERSPNTRDRSDLATIQRGYGNQAALRMLRTEKGRSPSINPTQGGVLQRKCACGNSAGAGGTCAECQAKEGLSLQAKLRISEPGDRYEQEADRVADQVMAASAHSIVSGIPQRIQRYSGQANKSTDAMPASVDNVLASPGRPLEPALQQDMEQRFGHNFSQVRVHSSQAAEQSAQEVNASAYTFGHNIVFGAGQFAPGTNNGRRLLAHELAHVVQQQSASVVPSLQRQPEDEVDDLNEVETGDVNEEGEPIDDDASADNVVDSEPDVTINEDPESLQLQAGAPTTGSKRILVKLPNTLIRFEGKKQISSWGISAGRPANPTPKGNNFHIIDRDLNHTSSSYGKCDGVKIGPDGKNKCAKKGGKYVGADMHFFQSFAPAVGFHRGDPGQLSHGCIHVNASNAATLWNWSAKGTPVKVE